MENNVEIKKSWAKKDISNYAYMFLTLVFLIAIYYFPCFGMGPVNDNPSSISCKVNGIVGIIVSLSPFLIILWVFSTLVMINKWVKRKRNKLITGIQNTTN